MPEETPSQTNTARVYDANKLPDEKEPTTPVEQQAKSDTSDKKDADKADKDRQHEPDPEENKRGRRGFFLTAFIVIAVLVAVFIAGMIPRWRSKPKLEKEAKAQKDNVPEVVAAPPDRAPQVTTLTLPANIQAVQETDISARASGYVQRWNVDIGDQVRRGQILAVISTPDVDRQVDQARAQVTQAQSQVIQQQAEAARALANLTQSRQNAERQRQLLVQGQSDLNLAKITADRWIYLVKEGAVSQQSADQQVAAYNNNRANVAALQAAVAASQSDINAYQAALRSSQANVEAAQANVSSARANLRRVSILNAFKVVRAPFSGVVTSRSVDAGALIGGSSSGDSSSGGGGSVSQGDGGAGGNSTSAGTSANGESGGAGQSSTQGSAANSSRSAMYGAQPDAGVNAGSGGAAQQVAGQNSNAGASGGTQGGSAVPDTGGANSSAAQTGGGAAGGGSSSGVSGTSARPATGSGGVTTTPASAQSPFQGSSGDEGIGGAVVSPGTSLYHIAKLDAVRVQINVPQAFVPSIRVGGRVNITVREFPGQTFYGRIQRTAATLDQTTRTLLTEIVISNPEKKLLPGMFSQVEFRVPRAVTPLLVPSGALITDDQGTRLAVVDRQSGKVHLASVTVGRDYGQQLEITSGISPNDLIVQDPSDQTSEGSKVKPVQPKEKQGGQGGSGGGQQGGQKQGGQGQGGKKQGGGQASGTSPSDLGGQYGGQMTNGPKPSMPKGGQ